MGYRYDRDELLAAAVEAALDEGLSRLTFGRLAKRIGVNDRTIVYYFPSKHELLTAVVFELGGRLQMILDAALGDVPVPEGEVVERAWPALATPASDPVFALYLEAIGLAAASVPPFDELAPALLDHWLAWLAPRIDLPTAAERHAAAAAALAAIDGLLILRRLSGAPTAEVAMRRLGAP